ncbi:uncharacterized protein [Drosophila kikkawai]|uniref:DUF4777 domain-containing protein n=1 Tax=Drosophila kikkawai TaxID=30033 RepID=A0A6P4J484_DROKI|nr:uncharacterized protein LOC108084158 [Drosophila kikkawai]
MNPTNLGKQNGALVMEVLKVLGRPATSFEVAERVSDVYRLPLQPIRPVVTDVLEGGVRQGLFSYRNHRYSVVQPVVDQLRRDIDKYASEILAMDTGSSEGSSETSLDDAAGGSGGGGALPQMSPLMLKLQKLDGSPPMLAGGNRYRRTTMGEQQERLPSGDVPIGDRVEVVMLPVSPI